jgi:glycerol uptake facilitator-like aquaporin
MKKYIAEGLGAFTLSFIVLMTVATGGTPLVFLQVIAALTLGFFVYTIGGLSGSHINPAVTVGVLSLKKISMRDATGYIIFQLVGGVVAFLAATMIFHAKFGALFSQPATVTAFVAETLGMFFFTFGIASVIYEKTPRDASGVLIGGSLLLGIMIASTSGAAGILNPAVALSLMLSSHSYSWIYLVAPFLGSYLGMQAYRKLI